MRPYYTFNCKEDNKLHATLKVSRKRSCIIESNCWDESTRAGFL